MTFTAFCVSDAVYQSLTTEQQTAVNESAVEAMEFFYELYEEIDSNAIQAMKDGGVTFHELDKEPLMAACAPALEKFVSDNGLDDMYAAIQALA